MSHWWNKKKLTSKVFGDVQIYTDLHFKSSHYLSGCNQSSSTQFMLSQVSRQGLQLEHKDENEVDEKPIYLLLLVVENTKKIRFMRRLQMHEQPLKLTQNCGLGWKVDLLYVEMNAVRLNEMCSYHHFSVQKFSMFIGCNSFFFFELLKRTMINLIDLVLYRRRRLFKLMKDCLVYYKSEKSQKMKYLQLDSISIETPIQGKEKYLFFMQADTQLLTLKANSRTDYEGWVYSIKKLSLQVKETKLFTDYDKKVEIIQKQKMDYMKNLINSASKGVRMLCSRSTCAGEIVGQLIYCFSIARDFIKFIEKQSKGDAMLANLMHQFLQENDRNKEQLDQLLQLYIKEQKVSDQTGFMGFIKHHKYPEFERLSPILDEFDGQVVESGSIIKMFQNAALQYIDQTYHSQYLQKGLMKHYSSRLYVQRFNRFIKFPLPSFQMFYVDLNEYQQ